MKKCTRNSSCAFFKASAILVFVTFCGLISSANLYADIGITQKVSEVKIDVQLKNKSLKEVLDLIEKESNYRFIYNIQSVSKYRGISVHATNKPVFQILADVLDKTPLTFVFRSDKVIIYEKGETLPFLSVQSKVTGDDIVVKGKVVSENGEPLIGVSIKVKNEGGGTTTDEQGMFTVSVSSHSSVLIFSYLGYQTQEVPVGTKPTLNVTLRESIKNLQEVVVIGYGTQRRQQVTSSVATVKAENFVKGPVADAGQLIQGKVAGMTVANTSGDPTGYTQILLRGNTTLFGANSDPLVLIDGVPGGLRTVAPEDIESIDVLKDGSAAAIYGVRGTNGVILITTKRAKGNGTNTVDYNMYASTQTIARKLDILTAADYRQQIKEGIREASWDQGSSTDWLKEITRTPFSHVHNLTFRGGNSKTNYLVSGNYRNLQGVFQKSDNVTFSGRADINHYMFNDKLKINIGILTQNNNFIQTADGGSFNGYTYRQALIRNPTAPIKNADGSWAEQTSISYYENPVSRLYESDGKNQSANTKMNSALTYTPIRDLKLNALFSYSRYNSESGYSETKNHISNVRDGLNGYAAVGTDQTIDRLAELTAEYSKSFDQHNLSLLGGYGYQEYERFYFYERNYDFPTDIFGYSSIQLGNALKEGKGTMFSDRITTNLISFFGRLQYSYADKYLLLASVRREAASQLYGADKPWGTFPAVSVGWRISKEGFMSGQKIFDDLKLRVGYGVTGNPPSDLFLGTALLGYGGYIYSNGEWIQTLGPAQNSNPYLKWEEKKETNAGLDFSMLNGRISGNIDYYVRKIDGLLYDYAVPSPPNLYSSTRANVGVMKNKGIEVLLNFTPVSTRNFQWTSSVNFSTNSNKLVSLSNDLYQATTNYFTTGGTGEPIQTFTHKVTIGQNIGDFYGFKVIGLEDNGKWIYEGKDGEPVNYEDFGHNFEDKKVLGNGLPKYYAGWNNNLRYKNLDLSVTMRGAFKYQILNFQRMYFENPSIQYFNRLKSAYDKPFGKALLTAPLEFNSYYIEDGDFWKVDNITLGYTINKLHSKYIKGLRVFATTLNTFTITGYKGIDPEVNRLGLSPGNDDRDKYPTTRTYTIGVNVNF